MIIIYKNMYPSVTMMSKSLYLLSREILKLIYSLNIFWKLNDVTCLLLVLNARNVPQY